MKLLDWYHQILEKIQRGDRTSRPTRQDTPPVPIQIPAGKPLPPPRTVSTRHLHVGVDYGTSWSKMVFRDYEAHGGEQAYVVFESPEARRKGEFRYPSLIAEVDGRLWFGSQAQKLNGKATVWPSIKIRMALPEHYHGRDIPLPEGLSADDLAALTVAYLLQHARRAVDEHAARYNTQARMSFTIGVPMSDFDNPTLRDRFAEVARLASTLERSAPAYDLRAGLATSEARHWVAQARSAVADVPLRDARKWIRPEVEAALLWAFKSPDTKPGLHAAVDVGAGTTSASFFFITKECADGVWDKAGLAFFGASCLPPGGDAICESVARQTGVDDPVVLRGTEDEVIQRIGEESVADIVKMIGATYCESLSRGYGHYPWRPAWQQFPLILLGGGTKIGALRRHLQNALWLRLRTTPEVLEVGRPDDLRLDTVSAGDLRFLLVAYGLSYLDIDIPSALTPAEIPPLDLRPKRIRDLDRDNLDEFRPIGG